MKPRVVKRASAILVGSTTGSTHTVLIGNNDGNGNEKIAASAAATTPPEPPALPSSGVRHHQFQPNPNPLNTSAVGMIRASMLNGSAIHGDISVLQEFIHDVLHRVILLHNLI
jgi:hypothetical protein